MNVLDFVLGPTFGKIIDKIFPDPAQKAQAQLAIVQANQAGEFKELETQLALSQAQNDVNKAEAGNASIFVSGARPFIMWVCGVALGVQFLVSPLATWVASLCGHPIQFPGLDMGTLLTLLGGMLGLGGFRTVEKLNGVARSSL